MGCLVCLQVDRSPTGSGVTARVALQYHRGLLGLNQSRTFESGATGSRFTGRAVQVGAPLSGQRGRRLPVELYERARRTQATCVSVLIRRRSDERPQGPQSGSHDVIKQRSRALCSILMCPGRDQCWTDNTVLISTLHTDHTLIWVEHYRKITQYTPQPKKKKKSSEIKIQENSQCMTGKLPKKKKKEVKTTFIIITGYISCIFKMNLG